MKRTKEEAEQTRERIFQAGLKIFSQKGYAAATLADVAGEAGISRGAIYWHYKNKEAFFKEVEDRLETYYDQLLEGIEGSGKSLLEHIRETVVELLCRFDRDREWRMMQEFFLRVALSHSEGVEPDRQVAAREQAEKLLKTAIEKRDVYHHWSSGTALMAVASLLSGVLMQIICFGMELDDEEIEEIADFVVRGFSPSAEEVREGE
mgnify:CR=1 FL=1